ncbi:hypothetical protein OG21DRAFT_329567 [Imleria badia]|nr:hypothetical protein OG21DRAFT_329567 [Imleria badia]
MTGLISCLLTWFDVFQSADIVRVGNRTEPIISTFAAALAAVTSVIGWAGILLNSLTYKERTFNLKGKLNAHWSRTLDPLGRTSNIVCGYYNPFVEATVSQTCYARTVLPGCKETYLGFEKRDCSCGLLCSNHVTYRFGKGMIPKAVSAQYG